MVKQIIYLYTSLVFQRSIYNFFLELTKTKLNIMKKMQKEFTKQMKV